MPRTARSFALQEFSPGSIAPGSEANALPGMEFAEPIPPADLGGGMFTPGKVGKENLKVGLGAGALLGPMGGLAALALNRLSGSRIADAANRVSDKVMSGAKRVGRRLRRRRR